MGFLAPAALGLSGLLGLILALHMLRPRQEERRVPSLFLWREVRQDPPAARPWKPLRRSPLLLLQLLALSLLVLALSRPWLSSGQAVSGEHLILLVDRSATMGATDLAPDRLAAARRRILDLVAGQPGARFTVIAFDAHPELLTSGETDPGRIRQALEGLTVRPVPCNASEALDFAASLALGQPETAVILYSDGAFDLAVPPPAGLALRFQPLGEATENQAISALSLTEGPALAGEGTGRGPLLFAQAANGGLRAARRRLLVEVDGKLLDARDLVLPPGGYAGFTLALPPSPRPTTCPWTTRPGWSGRGAARSGSPWSATATAFWRPPWGCCRRWTACASGTRWRRTSPGISSIWRCWTDACRRGCRTAPCCWWPPAGRWTSAEPTPCARRAGSWNCPSR